MFEIYMTECAQHICNNVGENFGGSVIRASFRSIIDPPVVTETADEIKKRIQKGLEELTK